MKPERVTRPSPEQQQIEAMISEGGHVASPPTAAERARQRWPATQSPTTEDADKNEGGNLNWLKRKVAEISEKLGRQYLRQLAAQGRLSRTFGRVPVRMRKVANQTSLVLELIDDFRDGTYRDIPWHSVAIASAGLLYTVSPADVVPDFIPFLGSLDDMALLAVATRFIEKDLRAYCHFKGYSEKEYF